MCRRGHFIFDCHENTFDAIASVPTAQHMQVSCLETVKLGTNIFVSTNEFSYHFSVGRVHNATQINSADKPHGWRNIRVIFIASNAQFI